MTEMRGYGSGVCKKLERSVSIRKFGATWLYLNVNFNKLVPVMWSLGIPDDFLFKIEAAKQ